MDSNQQRLFIEFFKSLPEKPATTIRFFSRGEYYTVHGSDAQFTAKEVFRTSSVIKTHTSGDDKLVYVNLNKSQFEALVKDLLLIKQYRVEVYVTKSKNQSSWTVEYKGSPGNLSQFEDILFSNNDIVVGSSILSVKVTGDGKNKVVGVALVDAAEQKFSVSQFTDDDNFTCLEAILVQFGPKECLLPNESNPDIASIKKVLERCGVLITSRKKNEFSTDNVIQDLNRLIKFEDGQKQDVNTLPQINLTVAISSLNAAIKYLEFCDEESGQFTLCNLDEGKFVHLDSAALTALGLAAPLGSSSNASSVIGLLDKCRTKHGQRLLYQWVKQPLRDINVINERHDIVELFAQNSLLRQSLHEDHLRKVPDFQSLTKRLSRKKASLQDCYRIYQGIERIPSLIECLEGDGEPHATLRSVIIDPLKDHLKDTDKFQEMIDSTLDMDLIDKGEFLVKAEFDEELKGFRDEMTKLEESLQKDYGRVVRDLGLDQKSLKLESNAQYGYFYRVTLKDEKVIRNSKEYKQLDATKSGVRFRSCKLESLNEDYLSVREKYSQHQQDIVDEIVSTAGGYCCTLYQLSQILAKLDVLVSFAVVAAGAPVPYVRPNMQPMGSGKLHLVKVRHPCLEVMDNISYIANDVYFNQSEVTLNIITGPNMGGKSTYIRSCGVVALLAHVGSLVPCESAVIPVLDAIMARVGAADSQIKGKSTFMVEMAETASIIKAATSNSLVIIDELGRGTSTYDGCGITWAIVEYLVREAKSLCLFATHFHELTKLAEDAPTVKNFHVTAVTSNDAITLLYQVKPGACDQSFGIHVAHMAGFPEVVIENAKRKLFELEDFQSAISEENDVKKRKIIQEGDVIIADMIKKCKELPLDQLSDEQLQKEIEKLKQQALEQNNRYINILINNNRNEIQSC